MKRRRLSKGRSKKMFRKTAMRTNRRNVQSYVMRGGIRL